MNTKIKYNYTHSILYQLVIFLNLLWYIFLDREIAKKKFLPEGGSWLYFISPSWWIGKEQLGWPEHSSLLNIVIRIKGNNCFTRISLAESIYREQFLLIQIWYRCMLASIKIPQCSSFQGIFSLKSKHA